MSHSARQETNLFQFLKIIRAELVRNGWLQRRTRINFSTWVVLDIKLQGVVRAVHGPVDSYATRHQVPSSWHGVDPLIRPCDHSHVASLPKYRKIRMRFVWCLYFRRPRYLLRRLCVIRLIPVTTRQTENILNFYDIVHSAALCSSNCWWRLYPFYTELRFPYTQVKKCEELTKTTPQSCSWSTLNKSLKTCSTNVFKFNPICRSRRIPRFPSVSDSRVVFLSFVILFWLDLNVCQCFALVFVFVENEVICFGVILLM